MAKYYLLILTLLFGAPVWAGETSPKSTGQIDYNALYGDWIQLASADDMVAQADNESSGMADTEEADDEPLFEERWFTANKVHKYLGIGSIAAAGLTLLAPKEENGAHEFLGRTAAGLGVAAVATGLAFHWDDIKLSEGFRNPDNTHALLTTLGTLGFLAAVSEAPDKGHAGPGAAGALSMLLGIKMTW